MEPVFVIDDAQVPAAKEHHVAAVLKLRDADGLAAKRFANEHNLAAPLDPASLAHFANLMIGVVPRVLKTARKRPQRRRPMRRWRRLPQGLVRALFVIVSPELIEARLLRVARVRGRPRRLRLQRAMHALVTAVVLWA